MVSFPRYLHTECVLQHSSFLFYTSAPVNIVHACSPAIILTFPSIGSADTRESPELAVTGLWAMCNKVSESQDGLPIGPYLPSSDLAFSSEMRMSASFLDYRLALDFYGGRRIYTRFIRNFINTFIFYVYTMLGFVRSLHLQLINQAAERQEQLTRETRIPK